MATLYAAAARASGQARLSGGELQEVYETFVKALTGDGVPAPLRQIVRWLLVRIGAYELADRLCDFATYGDWAVGAKDPVFLQQLARVRTQEDRLALLRQHQRWAAGLEAAATDAMTVASPIRRPGKLRLGIVASNLYAHPMAAFAMPLFEHRDGRFELFAYSFREGETDVVQDRLASLSTFRHRPGLSAREGAAMIAADDIDLLIDLNGVSNDHSLSVMAYRPGRLQASWLGYPHSTGLSAIDFIILDPHLATTLVLEQPLLLPRSWIVLPPTRFNDGLVMDPLSPEQRNGFLTFGTLNSPYKFTLESIATWARIMAACPNSKFLFGRPEAEAPAFKKGMIRRFGAEGISEDRLIFRDDPDQPMRLYNDIDISLDTFPLTGGVTTCEALWMGVPVVSMVGEALFERTSYALLAKVGLSELAVGSVAAYEACAIALALDRRQRETLRTGLRDWLKASPLCQPEVFCADFYALMAAAIRGAQGEP